MAKIIFENLSSKVVEVPDNSSIREACEKEGVPMGCSEGVCGMCVLEILEGGENLYPPNQAEKDFFGDVGSERLACQLRIKQGIVKVRF